MQEMLFVLYGLHMGVEGVAIPTLISRITAAVLMMILVRHPDNVIRITGISQLRPEKDMIRSLDCGIPSGLENGMFQFGKLMLQSLVSTLGTASIAGFAVANNLIHCQYLAGNALGLGLITIVTVCGRRRGEAGKNVYKKAFGCKLRYFAGCVLGDGSGAAGDCGLLSSAPEAAGMAEELILVHCFAMTVWPPAFALPNTLRAGMDARFTMMVSVFSMWVFRIGFAYLFVRGFGFGIMGVSCGMCT